MALGDTLGPYRITEQLGHGGMAQVYKAFHARLDRYVAIKVILPHFAREAGFRERFAQEAVAVARLHHPNILTVYDFGEERDLAYMVTEFVDGGVLSDRTGRPLDPIEVAELLEPVGSALDYAHGHGVLHRDVKPANILLRRDGTPVLSDFGIARLTDTSRHLTGTGMVMGTPAYQAPEQAQGKPAGPETDQYALAVVGYELLTGQVPYSAETPMAVLLAHLVQPLPLPRAVNPALSEQIEAVLLRGLAKQPLDRFPNCAAFGAALSLAARNAASIAAPPTPSVVPPTVFTRPEPDPPPQTTSMTATTPVHEQPQREANVPPTMLTPGSGTGGAPAEPIKDQTDKRASPPSSPSTGSPAQPTNFATPISTPAPARPQDRGESEKTEQVRLPPERMPTAAAGVQLSQGSPAPPLQIDAVDAHANSPATAGVPVAAADTVALETTPAAPEASTPQQGTAVAPRIEPPAVAPGPSPSATTAVPDTGVARATERRAGGSPWPLIGGAALVLIVLAAGLYFILGRSTGAPASVATPIATRAAPSAPTQPATSQAVATTAGGLAATAPGKPAPASSAPAPMPAKRSGHVAVALANGTVLVVGGAGPGGQLASAELYDPASNTWSAAAKLANAIERPSAALLPNGKVLVVGRDKAELFDPATNAWSPAGSMMATGDYRTATLLKDGKVLVVADNAGERRNSAELYDPVGNTWIVAPATDGSGVGHTATLLTSGKVLVAGRNAAMLYDPATNAWSGAGSMLTPRDSHTATLLPNGLVLVTGGVGATGPLATTERYDPAKNVWTDAGTMASTREEQAAVTLKDGKVLIVGGKGSSGPVAGAERYDPATNTWSAAGALAVARFGETATLLPNGQALIAGGDNGSGPINSVESYDPATSTWTATK